MENFSVTPAKRRRLEYVRRQFPCFNCCSPLLARRRRYNAVAKIGDSLVAPDVRMEKVVIGSSLEVVIGSSLEAVIDSSLEVVIGSSLEVAINDSLEVVVINDSLEAAIDDSLKAAINEISPSDELPISPSDELPKVGNPTSDEKDSKTLREFITESDVDDELKWGSIAKKLNRTMLACRKRMRMILKCGIYGEEKTGEHI